jgi:predicted membrane-bound spermidine synthase
LFWKNTAFAILSLAMLGIGASGVLVYLRPSWFTAKRADVQLGFLMGAFGGAISLSYVLVLALARVEHNAMEPLKSYVALVATGLLPFFFGGLVLSIVFTHASAGIARLYRIDLIGAALGAVLVVPALKLCNGPLLVPLLSLLAAVAGVVFSRRTGDRASFRTNAAAAACFAALAFAQVEWHVLDITHSRGQKEIDVEFEKWDPLARLTVQSFGPESKWLNIDSSVVTAILKFDGDLAGLDYLKHNVLQLAYHLKPYPKVLIIGPGGGSDVLSAVTFGNRDITAVEVNRTTISLMQNELRRYTGGLYLLPFVHIHIADGRAYVASMKGKVDLIQATFVDTFTASASGAHTLSENYLYTVEGFGDFLDHLNPDGVLSMSRWGGEAFSFAEIHRVVALAIRTLDARHVPHPEQHIVVMQGAPPDRLTIGGGYQTPGNQAESMSTLLVKQSPFLPAELDRLSKTAEDSSFRPVWLGARGGTDETLRALFSPMDRAKLFGEYRDKTGLDITPVTDNRPFFFDMIDPIHSFFVPAKAEWERHIYYWARTLDIAMLHQLLIATSLLAAALLVVPLLSRWRDVASVKRPISTLGYFVCLGLGYIGIELTLMQRFSLFLEHPVYSLVVFLSSILFFSGLGSARTARLAGNFARHGARRLALLVGILSLYGVLIPPFTRALIGLPLGVKMGIAVALAFPPAFLMGMMFPIGVAELRGRAERLVPWVWGLNSAFSVVGAVLSLFFAMSFGYAATWAIFVAAYALAGLALFRLARA